MFHVSIYVTPPPPSPSTGPFGFGCVWTNLGNSTVIPLKGQHIEATIIVFSLCRVIIVETGIVAPLHRTATSAKWTFRLIGHVCCLWTTTQLGGTYCSCVYPFYTRMKSNRSVSLILAVEIQSFLVKNSFANDEISCWLDSSFHEWFVKLWQVEQGSVLARFWTIFAIPFYFNNSLKVGMDDVNSMSILSGFYFVQNISRFVEKFWHN